MVSTIIGTNKNGMYGELMCGIVGYCGNKSARNILIDGLKRMEYRGYDSSGICLANDGSLNSVKKTGKISNLDAAASTDLAGHYGIGHTRWATHGGVTENNAHPHLDGSNKFAIAHNGIIENYLEIRKELADEGVQFLSETDSEVIVHLIAKYYDGDLEQAVKQTLKRLNGTYGLVVINAEEPDTIVGARNGSPLVLGVGEDEMFLASDVTAMLPYTKQVVYLDDGDIVVINKNGFTATDIDNNKKEKQISTVEWDSAAIEKTGFSTFMEKEIFEQPAAILRGLENRLNEKEATAVFSELAISMEELKKVSRITILAAGTSYYASMVFANLLEEYAGIPASAELSSEIRYRNAIVEPNTLYFVVSQSGETADTLYAMRELQRKGATVLSICNVKGSTIPRESNGTIYIHSGPEIAVASTKAFTSQLVSMYLFTLLMARLRGMTQAAGTDFINALKATPSHLEKILEQTDAIRMIADTYKNQQSFFFLGRRLLYPVALEGALKLKEISYIHAEGYAAGELKHGPIALITEETPSVFLVPDDDLREKVISNIKEIKARNGKVIAVAVEGDTDISGIADDVIFVPKTHAALYPFFMVVPLQLFAFHTALRLNRDIDQPRNLAKSVTVE